MSCEGEQTTQKRFSQDARSERDKWVAFGTYLLLHHLHLHDLRTSRSPTSLCILQIERQVIPPPLALLIDRVPSSIQARPRHRALLTAMWCEGRGRLGPVWRRSVENGFWTERNVMVDGTS